MPSARSAASWPSGRRRAGRRVPHFFVARDVDASALNATRETPDPRRSRSRTASRSRTPICWSPPSRARFAQHPRMNASWTNGTHHAQSGRQRRAGHGGRERRRHGRDSQRRQARRSATSRSSARSSPSGRAPTSSSRPTSPARRSRSAISACSASTRSRRSSCRRRRAFSPSARSRIASWRWTA